jgi:uracil-DNA glycosylase
LPHLLKQLHDLNPKLIIALGATPSSVLVSRTEVVANIGKMFKSKYGTIIIFPHPAYIARGVNVYVPIKELKEIAKKLIRGD